MIEIEIIIDGKKERMTLERFFESYWGLFKDGVLKVIDEKLLANGKLREILKGKE